MKIVISSASLLSLNISGNSALRHLDLRCAALTSLTASQCHRLEQLQEGFACRSLKAVNFAGCSCLQGASRSTFSSIFLAASTSSRELQQCERETLRGFPFGSLAHADQCIV